MCFATSSSTTRRSSVLYELVKSSWHKNHRRNGEESPASIKINTARIASERNS